MATRVQSPRLTTTGDRPTAATRPVGEFFINFADRQIGYIDDSQDPIDLVAIPFFSEDADYAVGDWVRFGSGLFRATSIVTAGSAFDSNDWLALDGAVITVSDTAPVSPSNATLWIDTSGNDDVWKYWSAAGGAWVAVGADVIKGVFSAARGYDSGDIVLEDGHWWQANTTIVAGAWNGIQWDRLSERSFYRGPFDAATDYVTGDVVSNLFRLWTAPAPVAAGAFDTADWNRVIGGATYSASAPSNPVAGDLWYKTVAPTGFYIYTGSAWVYTNLPTDAAGALYNDGAGNMSWVAFASGASATIGDAFPVVGLTNGLMHFLTVDPVGMYIYYDDGDSQQWVQTNGGSTGENYVEKTGDTMTGPLTVEQTINIKSPAGGGPTYLWYLNEDGYTEGLVYIDAAGYFRIRNYDGAASPSVDSEIVLTDVGVILPPLADDLEMSSRNILNLNTIYWDTGGASGDFMRWDTAIGLRGYENGVEVWRIASNGVTYIQTVYDNWTASAANVYVSSSGGLLRSTSSGEFKVDREDLVGALETISALHPLSFKTTHEADEGRRLIGFIAEEVAAVIPEASTDDGQNYDVRAIVAIQAKAIQELTTIVDNLIDRVTTLESA